MMAKASSLILAALSAWPSLANSVELIMPRAAESALGPGSLFAYEITDPSSLFDLLRQPVELPQTTAPHETSSSLDTFYRTTPDVIQRTWRIGLRHESGGKPVLNYGLQAEYNSGQTSWLQYNGDREFLFAGWQLTSKASLDTAIGVSELRDAPTGWSPYEHALLYYNANLNWHPVGGLDLQFRAANDFLYQDWVDGQYASSMVNGRLSEITVDESFANRWSLHVHGMQNLFQDGNVQRLYDGAILYTVFQDIITVRVGVGAGAIEYADSHNNYWSPLHYREFTGRTEVYYKFSDRLNMAGKLNVGHARESLESQGESTYGELRLNYSGKIPEYISLSYTHFSSIEDTGIWHRDDLGLSVSFRL